MASYVCWFTFASARQAVGIRVHTPLFTSGHGAISRRVCVHLITRS